MKLLFACLLLLLVFHAPPVQAKWITALSDNVRIALPDDYVVTAKEELVHLFEEGVRPIVHATSADEVIEVAAFYHTHVDMPAASLEGMLSEFEKSYPTEMPSLKWIASEIRTIGGTKAIYLEFSHTEGESPLTMIQVIFSHRGKMAMVQLACDTPKYGEMAGTLRKIVENLKVGS